MIQEEIKENNRLDESYDLLINKIENGKLHEAIDIKSISNKAKEFFSFLEQDKKEKKN